MKDSFLTVFDRLKKDGAIPKNAKPAAYRLVWMMAKCGFMFALCFSTLAQVGSVRVQWDQNPEADQVTSYKLYWAEDVETWAATNSVSVPHPITSATAANIPFGKPFRYWATATNLRGVESEPSTVAYYTLQPPITSLDTPIEKKGFAVKVPPQSIMLSLEWLPVTNATDYVMTYVTPLQTYTDVISANIGTSISRTMPISLPIAASIVASNATYRLASQPLTIFFTQPMPPGQVKTGVNQ